MDGGGARVSDMVVSLLVAQLNMASSVESFEGCYLRERRRGLRDDETAEDGWRLKWRPKIYL